MKTKISFCADALNDQQAKVLARKSQEHLSKLSRKLENELHCKLRATTLEDMVLYFVWANDITTRQQSFVSKPISVNEHYYWFRKKIMEPNCCMYILEFKNQAAGQIRFDIEGQKATISYSLAPEFRGMSVSSILLERGIRQLKREKPDVRIIDAFVKTKNIPSIKAFQKLGFSQTKKTTAQHYFFYHI